MQVVAGCRLALDRRGAELLFQAPTEREEGRPPARRVVVFPGPGAGSQSGDGMSASRSAT
ncbi:hypothetical protein GCM10012285_36520 [Streptomyces kronopolitis]|uniref:Uncharacterized protein n=1 Tax=Streptomyces kronopolitis TaxID=1612435 RepID=A0ABQ2JKJ2_9ACTN|nr:hypothetical protein GCM10012285_36520 [Streptomyces kronopolitis]